MLSRTSSDAAPAPRYQPKSAPIQRCRCYYEGRVQGVGFRYTTKNIAMRFDVNGYVRNLPDGRVELLMEGPSQQIQEMIQAVADRMNGYIRNVDTSLQPATGEFSQFHIRH